MVFFLVISKGFHRAGGFSHFAEAAEHFDLRLEILEHE